MVYDKTTYINEIREKFGNSIASRMEYEINKYSDYEIKI